jgi:hypothetical protein
MTLIEWKRERKESTNQNGPLSAVRFKFQKKWWAVQDLNL